MNLVKNYNIISKILKAHWCEQKHRNGYTMSASYRQWNTEKNPVDQKCIGCKKHIIDFDISIRQ